MAQQTRIFRRQVYLSARVRLVWYRLRKPWSVNEPASPKR